MTAAESPYALIVADLLHEQIASARSDPQATAAPIQAMARIVRSVEAAARARGVPPEEIERALANRTIGDIDLRRIIEHSPAVEYRALADELGVAMPGETVNGYVADGERYRALRERMMDHEQALLARGYDVHMYDLAGVGNPILREDLAADLTEEWDLPAAPDRIVLATGSLDALDKVMRGLRATRWAGEPVEMIFPVPCFMVVEWCARSHSIGIVRVRTDAAARYKLTADDLQRTLDEHPHARALYLTLSNNPTAFSYSPEELRELASIAATRPELLIFADMAYTGTGDLAEERARVAALHAVSPAQVQTFWSLSKVWSMTGDRFGWACLSDAALASQVSISWMNSIASLPGEWQLRFMAVRELLRGHPEIRVRLSDLYALRRRALNAQLTDMNDESAIFAVVNADDGGTIYNWSQLAPGQDALSLLAATGIAGVPGSAFGYSDDLIRLSVGIVPVPGWESFV
jgi:aspartate/methionine/tyrosine aminotransferase